MQYGKPYLIIISLIMFFCTGCVTKEKKPDLQEELVRQAPIVQHSNLLDNDIFIADSNKRIDHNKKYGPVTSEVPTENVRDEFRELINLDEQVDYTEFAPKEENAFPIQVNVENMDIKGFALMLSEISGVNILVSEESKGIVTAKLTDVPWPKALDSVLQLKSLAKHIDNEANIIRIHNQAKVIQLEDFQRNRLQSLQRSIRLSEAGETLYTEVFKLFYTKPDEIKAIIESVLNTGEKENNNDDLRDTQAKITTDPRVNQIIVTATAEDMDLVSKVIKKIDARTQQVLIEAFIVEVSDEISKGFGTRIGFDGDGTFRGADNKTFNTRVTGLAGTASDTVSAGTTDALISDLSIVGNTGIGILTGIGSTADLKFELNLLEQRGLTKVISNPRIFTLDNQEAKIFQGQEIPYETVSENGTEIEFKEAGLELLVTPSIVGDGNIVLDMEVNKASADITLPNPPITKNEIKTNLISKDGSIVVIGGIYTQEEVGTNNKTPKVGDIPVIGNLFKSETRQNTRTELMIFIAPKIL